jgi:tellurite resistance protein TerB
MFKRLFGGKAAAARTEIKKFERRDLMEALVGGCLLVSFADGECEEAEVKKVEGLLRTNKALEGFGAELNDTVNRFRDRLNTGYRTARAEILREIEEVKHVRNDAEDVLLNMLEVAEADGEVEPAEMKELKEVAGRLGLRLEDYYSA